jgi:hypothetical protein
MPYLLLAAEVYPGNIWREAGRCLMPEKPDREALEQSIQLLLEQIRACEAEKEKINKGKDRVYPWAIGGLVVGLVGAFVVAALSPDPVLPFVPPVLFGAIGVALGYSRQVEENAPRLAQLDQEITRLQEIIDVQVISLQAD